MMRAGASLTENRFFNNCGGKLFAKTGPILLDSNNRAEDSRKRHKIYIPKDWALEIIDETEWNMLKELEEV